MKSCLSTHERAIIERHAEYLLPPVYFSRPGLMGDLVDRIEDHLKHMTRDKVILYRFCLWVTQLGAFFYRGKFRLMTKMDSAFREQYFTAWRNSWWSVKRTIMRYLEFIVFFNFYGNPGVAKEICGYAPVFKSPLGSRDFPSANLIQQIPKEDIVENVDVCVVGSGAGGAVAAKELSEAGHSVVILEEGEFFSDRDFTGDDVSMIKKLYYGAGVTNTFGWPTILVPRGCCVGGTTLINSGSCFRTPDAVFDKWVNRFGLGTWAPLNMKHHYEEVEKIICVTPSREDVQGKSAVFFERGLRVLGHTLMPLMRNAPQCCGSGICAFGCPTNAKLSTQLNYIPLALQSGARLYTKCHVKRVLYKSRHATEVIGRFEEKGKQGPEIRVRAKVIVIAAGTLHTPILLSNSRVPDISGKIGHNLTLHPAGKVMALFDEEVRGWEGIPQGYYSDALAQEGIMIEGTFIPPSVTAVTLFLKGREHYEVMQKYKNIAMFGMIVSDTSRGMIIRGLKDYAIVMYNINRADLPKYRRGLAFLTDAFFEAGAKKIFLPIYTLPVVTREQGIRPILELKLHNKDLELYAFHPLGTCRMGADPREAVLDPNARLYGLDNLFVADGSIFPTSLGVNPMFTIMAAAHKIADYIHRQII